MYISLEILTVAVITAVSCALPGVFLVLRRMSMMADAITHTILLGIVLAFFATHDLSSPFLMAGAAASGVATVWLAETLYKTRLVSEDSAVGLVFPLLFSIAVILITKYAGSVHLDVDSVLLGEIVFVPFDRVYVFGRDIGAAALYKMGALLAINISAIFIFFKELEISSFDPEFAASLGLCPALVHYGLMGIVSLTAVGAFEAAGSVLVVAFMTAPPASAYLLTDSLKAMLVISGAFAAVSGVLGYIAAAALDVSIAGSIATVSGLLFFIVFLISPRCGLIGTWRQRRRAKFVIKPEAISPERVAEELFFLNELSRLEKNEKPPETDGF